MAFQLTVTALLTEEESHILKKGGPYGFYKYSRRKSVSNNQEETLDYLQETSKKRLLQDLLEKEEISGATWNYDEDLYSFNVRFYVYGSEKMDIVMEDLRFKGFGIGVGSAIHVVESTAYFCDDINTKVSQDSKEEEKDNTFHKFINSVKSRMTVVQIYQNVKDRGQITFDYLCFLITAAGIATLSLSTNNYPGIVASMLLSPLMDPILAVLFGAILRQKDLINEGMKNLSISIAISIVVGFLFGIICFFINFLEKSPFPTTLMMDRANWILILSILLFAFVSAPNLSTALLSNNSSAQIGNAISLSLLPPLVNTGYLWLLSTISHISKSENIQNFTKTCSYYWLNPKHKMIYFTDLCLLNYDFLIGGVFSFFITLSNILVIMIVGYGVFKFKKLASMYLLQEDTRKFYDKDLKEAYTPATMKTLKAKDPDTVMLKEMLKEYAQIQNKDIDQLSKREKKQLYGDLKDITMGVTEDDHFQRITHNTTGKRKLNIPEKFHEMNIKEHMDSDDLNKINISHVQTMSGPARKNYMRYIAKINSSESSSDHLAIKSLGKSKKPNSVGRFEIYTDPQLNPNASPAPFVPEENRVRFDIQ